MTEWMTGTPGTLNTSLKVLPLRQTASKATVRKSAGVGEQEWPDFRESVQWELSSKQNKPSFIHEDCLR